MEGTTPESGGTNEGKTILDLILINHEELIDEIKVVESSSALYMIILRLQPTILVMHQRPICSKILVKEQISLG